MRALFDLNVVLDVVQRRESHFAASAAVLSRAVEKRLDGFLPSHALPTLHYVTGRFAGRRKADELVDWLLRHFDVAEEGKAEFLHARAMAFNDFEDAVVAACALRAKCDLIITRNLGDFKGSPIPALTPDEFLAEPPEPVLG